MDIHGGRRSRAFPREYPKEDVALSRGFLRGYGRRNKTVLCRPRGISVREGGPALTFYREGRRSPTRPRSVFGPDRRRRVATEPFFASRPEREPSNGVLPSWTRSGRRPDWAFHAVRPVRHRFTYPRKKPRDKGHLPVKNREGRARAVKRPPDPHGFSRVDGAFPHGFCGVRNPAFASLMVTHEGR